MPDVSECKCVDDIVDMYMLRSFFEVSDVRFIHQTLSLFQRENKQPYDERNIHQIFLDSIKPHLTTESYWQLEQLYIPIIYSEN